MVYLPPDNHSPANSKHDAQRAEMIGFLRDSRMDIRAGRTQLAVQALERLAKKHGIRRRRK